MLLWCALVTVMYAQHEAYCIITQISIAHCCLLADTGNKAVRKIVIDSGETTTITQDGVTGVVPTGVVIIQEGAAAIVSDAENNKLYRVSLETGQWQHLSGGTNIGYSDGTASEAGFWGPSGLAYDRTTNSVLVCDQYNHALRRVSLIDGNATTVAGNPRVNGYFEGVGTRAMFSRPSSVAVTQDGLYAVVADTNNRCIRQVDLRNGMTSIIVSGLSFPKGVALSRDGITVYIADTFSNRIVSFQRASRMSHSDEVVDGSGGGDGNVLSRSQSQVIAGLRRSGDTTPFINTIPPTVLAGPGSQNGVPGTDGIGLAAVLSQPTSVSVVPHADYQRPADWLLFVDSVSHKIRLVPLSYGATYAQGKTSSIHQALSASFTLQLVHTFVLPCMHEFSSAVSHNFKTECAILQAHFNLGTPAFQYLAIRLKNVMIKPFQLHGATSEHLGRTSAAYSSLLHLK